MKLMIEKSSEMRVLKLNHDWNGWFDEQLHLDGSHTYIITNYIILMHFFYNFHWIGRLKCDALHSHKPKTQKNIQN